MTSSIVQDIVLVILLAGCFVGAAALAVVEVSLLRVRRSRVGAEADDEDGDIRSRSLARVLDDLPSVLNTVLLAVLLCQVGAATISGYLAQRWLGAGWIGVASVVISLLLFVYAEAVPKTRAMQSPYERALRSARWLRPLVRLVRPITNALLALADLQTHDPVVSDAVSESELRLLVRESAQAGLIGVADADLVDRSFVFGDTTVQDIMVSAESIVAVEAQSAVSDAMQTAIGAGHRRIVVLKDGANDVVGIVRLRDLAAASNESALEPTAADVMGPAIFCAPRDPIASVLEQMRSSGTWLAVVRDEAGLTVGLATVEDVVAELMGEIEEAPVVEPPRS